MGCTEYIDGVRTIGNYLSKRDSEILVGITEGLIGIILESISNGDRQCSTSLVTYKDDRYTKASNVRSIVQTSDYFKRLQYLCSSDTFISLKGSLGTITETIVAWNSVQSTSSSSKRIFVYDDDAASTFHLLRNNLVFSKELYRDYIEVHSDPNQLISSLERSLVR
jgi:predicted Rossmann-fold nucleotide-binding protein